MKQKLNLTHLYKDVLPVIKGHYWEVSAQELEARPFRGIEEGDYEIHVILWQRRKSGIKASVWYNIKPDLSPDNVRRLVEAGATDVARLMEITPKPLDGYYLKHSRYLHRYPDEWQTAIEKYSYNKPTAEGKVKFDIRTSDFEDLEYEFKKLLNKATHKPALPYFVTGVK